MADVKPSALANAVMGKLYDVLTNGDETVPASEDNFFTWCTPGIPVEPTDFEFLQQGLTGVVKKRDIAAATPDAPAGTTPTPPAPLTPAQLEGFKASDAHRMYQQAESLARLVDFVPDVTKVTNDQFARLNVLNNEGALSDVYAMTLRMSQVMSNDLPPETREKIAKFRALLTVTKKKKNAADDTETEVTEDSPMVVAYLEKQEKYDAAVREYNGKRLDALVGDNQRAVHDWAMNANSYRGKVKSAMRDWQTNGFKSDYESIAAFIEQVQARDMALLKEEYKDELEKARLTPPVSGSDFYYTTLAPASFATSGGWTKFTFSSGDFNTRSSSSYSNKKWSVAGSGSYFGIFGGRAGHDSSEGRKEYHGSFNSDTFGLSFEICQVPISRPWFKSALLTSKAWRFDPGSPDTRGKGLSDGAAPPKGMMPAYPTAVVFIRNLKMTLGHSEGFSNFVEEQKSTSSGGGGFLSFGAFFLGGSAKRAASAGSTERDWGYKFDDQGMEVPGMQIAGFKCHVLPKSPDPDPSINKWI